MPLAHIRQPVRKMIRRPEEAALLAIKPIHIPVNPLVGHFLHGSCVRNEIERDIFKFSNIGDWAQDDSGALRSARRTGEVLNLAFPQLTTEQGFGKDQSFRNIDDDNEIGTVRRICQPAARDATRAAANVADRSGPIAW